MRLLLNFLLSTKESVLMIGSTRISLSRSVRRSVPEANFEVPKSRSEPMAPLADDDNGHRDLSKMAQSPRLRWLIL